MNGSNVAAALAPPRPRRGLSALAAYRALLVALFLVLWEAAGRSGLISPLFFSPPSAVARKLVELLAAGQLWPHLGTTAMELLLAYAIAVAVGIAVGLILGSVRYLRDLFVPYVFILFSFPKIAVFPLFIVWFGIGLNLKVAYAAVSGVFPIILNIVAGFHDINPSLLVAARSMGASRWQVYQKVVLPSIVPMLFAGLRIGLNFAILGVLIAELIQSRQGMGALISQATSGFRADELYSLVVLTALLVLLLNEGLGLVERRLSRWSA